MHHYLRPLLAPQSVALVGASDRPESLGRTAYENLLAGQFSGELYAVNPKHRTLLGRPAFPSLEAIGARVELAVIATPPDVVADVLAAMPSVGLKAAIVMTTPRSSDRAEALAWTRKVASTAKKHNVRVVGPGALGVIRTDIGLNATFCAPAALPGRLALVAQSGAVSAAMLDFATPLGIGFSTVISLGGGIDVGIGELLDFLLLDPATDGILLYVEEADDARTFLSALRAAARTKPVIVLKAGRSLESRRDPTPDAVFDAALKRAGSVRVQTYAQLFAAARVLALGRIPQGNRLAIVSNGRGPALLAADSASQRDVVLSRLTPATVEALHALLPLHSARANPVDVRGYASPTLLADAVAVVLRDPNVDAALALHVARPVTGATDAARAVAEVARQSTKPVFGAWLGAVDRREVDAALDAGGIGNYFTPENAVEAFSFVAAYRRNQRWLLEVPPPQPLPDPPDTATAERIRARAEREGKTRIDTEETFALLSAFGLSAPPFAVVETLSEAEANARRMRFPVTLSLESDVAEDAGARTVIRTRDALAKAWGALHIGASRRARAAAKGRAIVRRRLRAEGSPAYAIRVAIDRTFGPVIMLCPSSSATSAYCERTLMLPPLNRRLATDLAQAALDPAHSDHRNDGDTVERDALAQTLTQVSSLVCALPWVRALDLDPLIVDGGRVQVLAARVVVDPKRKPSITYRHLAIHPYPAELIGTLALRDGTAIPVRPIRPEDAGLEREFVHALSDETRYFRFFYQLNELTPAMLARFTQVDYDRELALVALTPATSGGESIVSVARYIVNPDRESAEFAIVVADAWHRRGVAKGLMERLIAAARRRGIARLEGTVLRANVRMLRFTAALGFRVRDNPDDGEQVIVELPL